MPTCLESLGGDLKLRLQESACISGYYGVHIRANRLIWPHLVKDASSCILPTYLVFKPTPSQASSGLLSQPTLWWPITIRNAKKHYLLPVICESDTVGIPPKDRTRDVLLPNPHHQIKKISRVAFQQTGPPLFRICWLIVSVIGW